MDKLKFKPNDKAYVTSINKEFWRKLNNEDEYLVGLKGVILCTDKSDNTYMFKVDKAYGDFPNVFMHESELEFVELQKPRIIILEGVDGGGKSFLANLLNQSIPLSTVLKLSGAPKDIVTEDYMKKIYQSITPMLTALSRRQYVILDRCSTSERVYPSLCKPYVPQYIDEYESVLVESLPIIQFYLHVSDELMAARLELKKKDCPNEKQPDMEFLKRVRDRYEYVIAHETKYPTHIIDASLPADEVIQFILEKVGLDVTKKEDAYSQKLVP